MQVINGKRLKADLKESQTYLAIVEKKLANDDFSKRAPKNVVEAEEAKKREVEEKIAKIEGRLEILR